MKQEWCSEVGKLLQLQLEKLSTCLSTCITIAICVLHLEQAKAHDSGSKLSESLPPPMMHSVELPSRYQKHKKTVKK